MYAWFLSNIKFLLIVFVCCLLSLKSEFNFLFVNNRVFFAATIDNDDVQAAFLRWLKTKPNQAKFRTCRNCIDCDETSVRNRERERKAAREGGESGKLHEKKEREVKERAKTEFCLREDFVNPLSRCSSCCGNLLLNFCKYRTISNLFGLYVL